MELPAGVSTSTYTYAGTGYANPHAVTSIGNGVSTATYAYDNDGNLTSAGNGTATTTYGYDYANRLISLSNGGAKHHIRLPRFRSARVPDHTDHIHQHVSVQILLYRAPRAGKARRLPSGNQ